MKEYVIVANSTTDLPNEYAVINNLVILPLRFQFKDKEYINYLDYRELSVKDFYQKLRDGEVSKTTQVNVDEVEQICSKIIEEGKDILYISFSSGLSGSYNSARIAKEIIEEKYPDAKMILIDSKAASMGEGLLVHYAIQAKKRGMTLEENAQYVEDLKLHICHWFTVGNIDTLRRGGRVSSAAAFVAKTLNIKPVLHVDNNGKLIPRSKKIGRKKAILELIEKMEATYVADKNEIIFISHGDCLEDAMYLKGLIEEKFGMKNFLFNDIGPVIGSHSGPDTIALFFVGTSR